LVWSFSIPGSGEPVRARPATSSRRTVPSDPALTSRLAVLHETAGALGDEDLPAVRRGGDASSAMDVDADVVTADDERLARVQAHAHADGGAVRPGVRGERLLGGYGRSQPGDRVREGDEEAVALRVDLAPAVPVEGVPQQPTVFRQDLGILVAEIVEQPGRALDVREEERDNAGR
jgi:hypothetical protein